MRPLTFSPLARPPPQQFRDAGEHVEQLVTLLLKPLILFEKVTDLSLNTFEMTDLGVQPRDFRGHYFETAV